MKGQAGGHQHTLLCLFQTCPDSVWTQVANTEFNRTFVRSIPVLQWAPHATREQYDRLSRYPGSHGWGGVQYNSESPLPDPLGGKRVLCFSYSPSWSQTGSTGSGAVVISFWSGDDADR